MIVKPLGGCGHVWHETRADVYNCMFGKAVGPCHRHWESRCRKDPLSPQCSCRHYTVIGNARLDFSYAEISTSRAVSARIHVYRACITCIRIREPHRIGNLQPLPLYGALTKPSLTIYRTFHIPLAWSYWIFLFIY